VAREFGAVNLNNYRLNISGLMEQPDLISTRPFLLNYFDVPPEVCIELCCCEFILPTTDDSGARAAAAGQHRLFQCDRGGWRYGEQSGRSPTSQTARKRQEREPSEFQTRPAFVGWLPGMRLLPQPWV